MLPRGENVRVARPGCTPPPALLWACQGSLPYPAETGLGQGRDCGTGRAGGAGLGLLYVPNPAPATVEGSPRGPSAGLVSHKPYKASSGNPRGAPSALDARTTAFRAQ